MGAEAAPDVPDADRKRVLLAGDAEGGVAKLFKQVENQLKKTAMPFDVLFCVGGFLPGQGTPSDVSSSFAEYATGKKEAPVETYFLESRSAALLQTAPDGKKLFDKVHFLGRYGVREICGLRVAYLSGHYDSKVYDGDSSEAFVGPAYTRHAISALREAALTKDAAPVDVLLTAEWPSRLDEKLDPADRPIDPDEAVNWLERSSSPVAELCVALEPRYHIFGNLNVFYQRPPFQTPTRGHVCRCIALGKVGSKGKFRQWVHALSLCPAGSMPASLLKQRPENTTPCPFIGGSKGPGPSLKRTAAEMSASGTDAVSDKVVESTMVPNRVFLSKLPARISEKQLEAAFKKIGKIERIKLARDDSEDGRPCRGFGWVTFETAEQAQEACDLNELLECNGRPISIELSKEKGDGERKEKKIRIAIEPHADCWFCLVNPKVEKHMVVSATPEVYVATARGPINPAHALILPVKHAPCYAACPPELQAAVSAHVDAMRTMFREAKYDVLLWERWIPMGSSAANHMMLQVLPVGRATAGNAREVMHSVIKKDMPGVTLTRIHSHAEVADHMNDDTMTSYIYFEIPGENTARGRDTERYMFASVAGGDHAGVRIPIDIGRRVACQLLECESKLDWRRCQEDRDAERELAKNLRERFKAYMPS